jgi:hypothetical protein
MAAPIGIDIRDKKLVINGKIRILWVNDLSWYLAGRPWASANLLAS